MVYSTSSSGHFDPWDGTEYFLITESMALKHSAKVYPDLPTLKMLSTHSSPVKPNLPNPCFTCEAILKPTYLLRPLLGPGIAVPFYYAALIFSVSPITVVALFANSFVISLTCVLLFCFSLELYKSKRIAFVLTLIFGVCSFIWPYNSSLMSEPTTTLCIFASAYFIYMLTKQDDIQNIMLSNNVGLTSGTATTSVTSKNNKNKRIYFAALGGLFLGLSLISHPSDIVIIPGFLAYFIFSIRRSNDRKILLLLFLIVLGGVLLLAASTNYIRFGSVTRFGYGDAETLSIHRGWHGLIGLLVSPGKGLVFYFPIAILLPLGLRYIYAKNKGVFFICIYTFVAFWLFFGTSLYPNTKLAESETWSGGWWGPRYLVPVLPFITLLCGTLLERSKGKKRYLKLSGVIILGVIGFLVNLIGILVWWEYANVYGNEGLGQDPYAVKTWSPYNSFIVKHIGVLMSNYVSQVQPVKFSAWSYTLAPCPYDNYLYCKFGILPILSLSVVIGIVAMILLMKIGNFKCVQSIILKSLRIK
ncbi:MAG: hypothetical protein M3044_06870 [Thermoproteota archaeon]|nr:hypothetical protein [Thermoproteota archaeon]